MFFYETDTGELFALFTTGRLHERYPEECPAESRPAYSIKSCSCADRKRNSGCYTFSLIQKAFALRQLKAAGRKKAKPASI